MILSVGRLQMKSWANIFLTLAIITASETLAFSQDNPSPLDDFKDETIIYTASKTREQINKTAATVTVITDMEIRNMGARDLLDILSTVPGFGMTIHNWGFYELESRGIKTLNSEKILIMVNGHPLYNAFSGGAVVSFHKLIVENIKKIEIVRGPGSAIYGANAFLAVVNIFTKEAADVDGLEVTSGGGSYGTQQHNLMLGKIIKDLEIYANFNFLDTNGFKGFVPQDRQTIIDEFSGTNASKSPGYTNSRLWKYDLDIGARYHDFAFKGRYTKDNRGLFSGVENALDDKGRNKFENYFLELSYSHAITGKLDFNAKTYSDYNEERGFLVIFPPGYANPMGDFPEGFIVDGIAKRTKHGAEILFTLDWTKANRVLFGAMGEYQRQFDVRQKTNYNPLTGAPLGDLQDVTSWANWNKNVSRNLWAVYMEDLFDIRDNLRLTTGARYDRYSDFGSTFNPRIGIVWEFIKSNRFKLIYGRAFRAPSFEELYTINNPVIVGNPRLKPETVNTIEFSLGSEITKAISSRITLFRNSIDNTIAPSAPDPVTGISEYVNSQNVLSEGVEVELKTKFNKGSYLLMNYTFQHPRYKITGRLANIPSQKGNIMANWQIIKQFNLYSQLFLKGKTPRASGDTRGEAPGYGLVNSTLLARNLLKGWEALELRLSIYNLLGHKYADPAPADTLAGDYPRPGRSIFGEVRYTFY